MGPVKESDLLKTVKDNNRTKFLKYLSPEKSRNSSKKLGIVEDQSTPGGRIRLKLAHVNIDCHEESTGYTPLIIAVLNGNKDIVEDLLFHSADVNCQDVKGNTALHMAVFAGKVDLVDILLNNKARVNIQNSDENTALHIACQATYESRVHIMLKLLQKDADHMLFNKDGKTPLDIAAMFNKTDAVSVLLDHDQNLEESKRKSTHSNTLAMIEASIRGYKDVVEMMLDYGYDPNALDQDRDTTALMEAVRFVRIPVVETLLKYGAKTDVKNSKSESPESLLKSQKLPQSMVETFEEMFEEYKKSGATESPRFLKILSRGISIQGIKDFPLLPNDTSWTRNTLEYCNSCTPNAPNTNILNDDLTSCWIAAEVHQAWTVLDLKYQHIITGITIYGWDSPQMVRAFELQRGKTLEGPWSTVVPCACIKIGSTSLSKPGVPQTFTDFTARSRYWRLLLVDNHGGKCICFHGIRFYGADDRIRQLLKENDMDHYADDIVLLGFNTYKKFLLIDDDSLKEAVSDKDDRNIILKSLERDRPKGVQIRGVTEAMLQSDSLTDPSVAKFSGIIIDTVGKHVLTIQCVDFERVQICTPQPIEIKPKTALRQSVALAFDDMEAMLNDLTASLGPVKE